MLIFHDLVNIMKRKLLFLLGCVLLLCVGYFIPKDIDQSKGEGIGSESLLLASETNYNNINSVFAEKLSSYNTYGVYPQRYEPSLQATFYGVATLDNLGKLDQAEKTDIIDYIMEHYNESSGLFMDKYAYRYLDTDFSQVYYPLNTVLEVNSYSILALERLGALGLVDVNKMITFLWSCYNPVSSGFIGQPYSSALRGYFNISTIDNTYYAIKTLDLLMSDWNSYTQQRNDLVSYINSLQITENYDWRYGGFINDIDDIEANFNSLPGFTEPYLFSSYYSIKSLQIFGMVGSININNFHLFLGSIYNSDADFFYSSPNKNKSNIVASALGLDLSLLTGFTLDDETNLSNFIYTHRNSLGIWDGSTTIQIHELIDTFQIVRSLKDAGKIGTLLSSDVEQIVDTIIEYYGYQGFSLISIDYPTMTLLHTLVSSFDLYERVSELDLLEIYRLISEAYVYEDIIQYNGFYSYSNIGILRTPFRTFPIEFYSSGHKINNREIGYELSHRATFEALNSLSKIFKLDDFGHTYDLTKLKDDILDSQFLNLSYPEQHGAFSYIYGYDSWLLDYLSKNIYFEYSFYVIKTLELLVEELNIGDITFLDFDIPALESYINNHMVETSGELYFKPSYTNNSDSIIENTYYTVYILKALDLYDIDEDKIKNHVLANINYSSIKSVYYSYKLSNALNGTINLNYNLIYNLIGEIYDDSLKEYYLTTDRQEIEQEILWWISDMVVNDLGSSSTIVNIEYLASCEFLSTGNYINFSITSKYSGTYWFWVNGVLAGSSTFQSNGDNISISLDNYASVLGNYTVKINATALDGRYGEAESNFNVYSDSSTIVNIEHLESFEFLSTGNVINFSIISKYSGTYWFWINNLLVNSSPFQSNGYNISISLDNYSDMMGDYIIKINATAQDGRYGEAISRFSVYSDSSTVVNIDHLVSFEFLSVGNTINFSVISKYSGTYWYWINGLLINSDIFQSNGHNISISLDSYTDIMGDYTVKINATALDGRYGEVVSSFSVYTDSSTIVNIEHLESFEFLSTENNIIFNISSKYSGTYWFWVNDLLVNSSLFQPNGGNITISLDNYSNMLGNYAVKINATALDGHYGEALTSFSVYTDSSTIVSIEHLINFEFLSTGNNINFSITSKYSGTYWFWINGLLINSDTFQSNGYNISISLDNYKDILGNYTVKINATALDGGYGEVISSFNVYSDSSTIVNILSLTNYEFFTTGYDITFSVHSSYPDIYNFSINGFEINSGTYYDGQVFTFSIDGYEVGNHEVVVWARGLDNKECVVYGNFSVYSTSETIITIYSVDNYVYNSTGNVINFSISTNFPEYYTIEIDGVVVDYDVYFNNIPILYSIDGYDVGRYVITIWANSSDKKESIASIQFDVFSAAFLEIEIQYLQNYEFKSTGNYVLFFINASFPDSFQFFIDGFLNGSGNYLYGGELFNFSIDGYFVGEHNISIWANSTDEKEGLYESSFTVYSLSNTIVNIEELPDYELLTVGSFAKFSIISIYPDYYILSIDGIEVNRSDYESGVYYYVPIDGYGMGTHTLSIWAIGEDGKIGTGSGQFNVYSNSTTIIVVNQVLNYEFMTTENSINFSITSNYIGTYNVSIDGILVDSGNYTIDEIIFCSSDGYTVGTHNVSIFARSIDGKEAQYHTDFAVFSNSTTIVNIHGLGGFEFMSTGNFLNFSINSTYPDYYELWIDGILVVTDNYSSGSYILYSLDNYSHMLGNHSVYIWAVGKDFIVGYLHAEFNVYSNSTTIVTIHKLEGLEFMSTGNFLNFSINSSYPDYYELWINGILVSVDNYSGENYILYSLDNYTAFLGNYSVFIWAIGKDFKVGSVNSEFNVYSTSSTIITIHKLDGCEFLSTGNYINFSIDSSYPDRYELWIDGVLVLTNNYSSGSHIIYSLDNHTTLLGNHSIYIWAIGLDGQVGTMEVEFSVYSASSTIITINELEGCEFLSVGNYINFSIYSNYPDYYELWIDGVLVSTDNYTRGGNILYSLDGYAILLGNHSVYIWAVGLDGKVGSMTAEFLIYSSSSTFIAINKLEVNDFLSLGNYINFTVFSTYSDYYELWIDGMIEFTNNYSSGSFIIYSLDNYTSLLGNHSVYIWAIGLDGKVGTMTVEFEILSIPNDIIINIIKLDNYEYNSTGNELQFSITSQYPNYYMISIDTILLFADNYSEGELNVFSIDNYEIGVHNLTIWVTELDGKEAKIEAVFTVYSKAEVNNHDPLIFDPPITAFIFSGILIFIPGMFILISYINQQKIKSFLPSKKPKISFKKYIKRFHK